MLELEEVRRLVGGRSIRRSLHIRGKSRLALGALSEPWQEIAAARERKKNRGRYIRRIWKAAHAAARCPASRSTHRRDPRLVFPFLSEPWYCLRRATATSWSAISAPNPLVKKIPSQPPMALF